MKIEIKIPSLGESISEVTIGRLLKPNHSLVKLDEEILEIETDKVNQVLYAPQTGTLSLSVKQGDSAKVGQVIGFIDTEGKAEQKTEQPATPPPPPATPPPAPKIEQPTTPLPKARLTQADFITPQPPPAAPPTVSKTGTSRKKMSALRKVIASRLVEVKNTTAMLTTFNEIDMSAVMAIRTQEKEKFLKKHGVKLGFMSFFVKAVVAALKAIPEVNAMIDKDEIITYSTYDIGVAVSTDKGLMVPVISGCDAMSFAEIEKALELYAKKAREATISIQDLQGGSFTITNGGVFGSLLSTPILNPPQSAILGMHAIVKRPVVVDDQITIRPMMYIALSYDHRLIDGKEAVQFLVHIKQSLEDPSRMLLDL
ncbi:MAG: dihydrolipoyLLysine-residue succinyltransferase component of 2-oxoglutarate dehydrogenase complex [Chlamydiota bacterium]|jgi:2-oxoglutarate dehydrogenase E2 component (dihydrolipoamide succinyltransferase)